MDTAQKEFEKQLVELREEVARLRNTIIYGFSALGAILLIGLFAPGLGVIALVLASLIVILVSVGAALGIGAGRAFRAMTRHRSSPTVP